MQWNKVCAVCNHYRKELKYLIYVTLHIPYHDLMSRALGPDGSVCISSIASDVRRLWLPVKISQMLVCKQQSHQKLKIVLELDEIHFCCGKLHACNSLFVFLKPDKIL